MRNENKIVELLSESLKRQDQMVEQMSGMNTRLNKHESVLGRIVKSLDNLTDVVIQSNERLASIERKLDDLADLRDRVKRIEKHIGLE